MRCNRRIVVWSIPMLLLGGILQSWANNTLGVFIVLAIFGLSAVLLSSIFFANKEEECSAVLLNYSVCILIGGLVQAYSFVSFGEVQSTIDSRTFFGMIAPSPPFVTLANLPAVNAPLAILLWQGVYKLTWFLGLEFGPYTGVQFNALIVGLIAGLVVSIARVLFGSDRIRLNRLVSYMAFCGMFWLFGSVFVRDSILLLFNTIVLWAIVQWLSRSTLSNFIVAIFVSAFAIWAMIYLREESVYMASLCWVVAIILWFKMRRINEVRLLFIVLAPLILVLFSGYISSFWSDAMSDQQRNIEGYAALSASTSSADSLGMRFVVNQSLPIRIVLGSAYMLIFPFPLWSVIVADIGEYQLLKGVAGAFQMAFLPLVISGTIILIRTYNSNPRVAIPMIFICCYLIMNITATSVTSLETRHFGQAIPCFLILSVIPDLRISSHLALVKRIGWIWISILVILHLSWFVLRF